MYMDIGSVIFMVVWGGGKGDGDEFIVKVGVYVCCVDVLYSDFVFL